MEIFKHHILGAISGSSLDGLDLASTYFELSIENEKPLVKHWEITKAGTIPFPNELYGRLKYAPHISAKELCLLDAELGQWMGEQIKQFLIDSRPVEYICSHGHTVFHEPEKGMTCQIGHGAHIASKSGIPVIDDVRYADIAAGGVGAPFAPLADKYLLHGYQFYLNLGGITNLTHMLDGEAIAWDLGGCNQLLNHLAQKLDLSYDRDGEIARNGQADEALLTQLMALFPIYLDEAIALDNQQVVQLYFPVLDQSKLTIQDLIATSTMYIVTKIEKTIERIFQKYPPQEEMKLIATGGGALNRYMMERLAEKLAPFTVELVIPDQQMIEFKEAALLALMGLFRIHHIPNSLPSVTKAQYPPIGGALHQVQL